jgi:hypothetical protein
VTGRIEKLLEKEEQEVPIEVLWQEVEAMGWIEAQDPIQEHASVSIDGLSILIRDERYREVKAVSISEAVTENERENSVTPDIKRKDQGAKTSASAGRDNRGRQDDLKLTRHSYRAVLGDKEEFAPALKTELARRRVGDVDKITTPNDGADWIWNLVQAYLPDRRVEVLDWYHAVQNLAKAAKAAFGEEAEETQSWLSERKTELWNGQRMDVERALYHLPRRYKERGKAIRQVKHYIDNHWARLQYNLFREEGRPIGSGTIESGAKNVVAWRMKRGGQRWSRPGAKRMLAALGEVHSGRWDAILRRLDKAA